MVFQCVSQAVEDFLYFLSYRTCGWIDSSLFYKLNLGSLKFIGMFIDIFLMLIFGLQWLVLNVIMLVLLPLFLAFGKYESWKEIRGSIM